MLFSYQEKKSFLNSIDPVSKLFWVISVFICSLLTNHALPQVFVLGTVFFMGTFLAKISIKEYGLIVGLMGVFSISFFIYQSLVIGGSTGLFRIGWLSFSAQGMDIAGAVALRGLNLIMTGRVFVGTTNPRDLAIALVQRLKVSYVFAFMILMVLRYFPLFEEEYRELKDARLVRGVKEAGAVKRIFNSMRNYGIPLISRGLRRAETTSYALDSRAFRAFQGRTYMREIVISRRAVLFMLISTILMTIGLTLNYLV
jgi:energy-coupling factor transporter transmembrane protein EcfT